MIQNIVLGLSRMTGNHKIPNFCGQLHKLDVTSCKDDQRFTYISMVRGMRKKHLIRSAELHTDQILNV